MCVPFSKRILKLETGNFCSTNVGIPRKFQASEQKLWVFSLTVSYLQVDCLISGCKCFLTSSIIPFFKVFGGFHCAVSKYINIFSILESFLLSVFFPFPPSLILPRTLSPFYIQVFFFFLLLSSSSSSLIISSLFLIHSHLSSFPLLLLHP
jgi:hypothetical protein